MTLRFFKFTSGSNPRLDALAGCEQIFSMPFTSIVIIVFMAFSMFLAMFSHLLWGNRGAVCEAWNRSSEISLYLKQHVDQKAAAGLAEKIRLNPLVAKVEFISKSEGLEVFAKSIVLNIILSSFKENPLPNVIIVYPQVKILSKSKALGLISDLKSRAEVDTVRADIDWLEHSHHWLNLWGKLALLFVLVFSINAFFVVGGISCALSLLFAMRDNGSRNIISYQFTWYALISGLLAILLVKWFTAMLGAHGVPLAGIPLGSKILMVLGGVALSFGSSRHQ